MLRRFAEPVALLLMLSVLLEIAGAYPALKVFRAYSIIGGAACIAMALPFITNPLQQAQNAFRALPMIPALLYLIWTAILGYFSPYPVFAHTEILRVFCGVLAFFLIVGRRSVVPVLLPLLIAGAVLLAGYDFYLLGLNGSIQNSSRYSAFATHQELGSLLLLIVPSCLGLALATLAPVSPEKENSVFIHRMATSGATLFLFLALLISRCRSAWFGMVVALLLGVALTIWYLGERADVPRKTKNNFNWFVFAVVPLFAVLALLAFFSITQSGQTLINRAATMPGWRDDLAMQDRFRFWEGGLKMAQEHPWMGWGPGSYLVLQNHWTGIGYPKEDVLLHGVNHGNIAHNYYVQWMADTGFTGLALHGILLVTFGIAVARRLGQLSAQRAEFYRAVPVIVGVATMAGTAVDAFSSPSYNFHPISLLWWVLFGVAVSYTVDTKGNA